VYDNRGIEPIPLTQSPPARGNSVRARPRLRGASAFALFLLLALVHTWPLATAPSRLSRNDNADTLLNEWIVGWVAHQLPRQPLRLFDGNIFYPDRATLTYSEPLLVPAVLGAPLSWAGASPVLVYNVLVVLGLSLTGWAAWLLLTRWTADPIAATCGALIVAFNAHTLTRLPQLQALHIECLPLALLAFDRTLTADGRRRDAVWLGVCLALQAMTSLYGLVFTMTALIAGGIVRVADWPAPSGVERPARRLALAAAVAVVAIVPVLAPYASVRAVRPLSEVAMYSATWRSYLMTPARLHYWWSGRFFAGDTALFPGIVAVALAAAAILTGIAFRDRRARMGLGIAVAGLALSFGPALPGYQALYTWIWPLRGIRNAARFGYLLTVGFGILAAFALADMRRRWRGAGMQAVVAMVLVLATLDALAAPIELVDADRVSPIHALLEHTDAVVAEFPFYPPDRMFRQAAYLLHAMQHWRPMVNGYSGLVPASYIQHSRELAGFPDEDALSALRRLGVTHVFVHDRALREWTNDETADAVTRSGGLKLIARDGDVSLYEVRRQEVER
jgi:hypothetical protein